jgi:putative membrane protein
MFNNLFANCFSGRGLDRFSGGYGGMMGGGFSWIGMIIGGLFSLAFLVLFVLLIVWLVRMAKRSHNPANFSGYNPHAATPGQDAASALRILNERYAHGEISEEEYLKMKKNLTE